MADDPAHAEPDLIDFIRSAPEALGELDLNRIPGASERIEAGLADLEAGRLIPLDEL